MGSDRSNHGIKSPTVRWPGGKAGGTVQISRITSIESMVFQINDVTVNAVAAEDWECRALVAKSEVPDKQSLLDIRRQPVVRRQELAPKDAFGLELYERISAAAESTASNYGEGSVVEQRTMIPAQTRACVCEPADAR